MSSHICYLPTHFARRGIMETSEKWTFNCLVFSCHVFKWWSENQTRFSPVFKWHSNTGPFGDQTSFDHLNTNCSCLVESCFWTQRLNQEKCLLKNKLAYWYLQEPQQLDGEPWSWDEVVGVVLEVGVAWRHNLKIIFCY